MKGGQILKRIMSVEDKYTHREIKLNPIYLVKQILVKYILF